MSQKSEKSTEVTTSSPDHGSSNILTKQIIKFFNSNMKHTSILKNIAELVIFLSVDEIQKILASIIIKIKTYISEILLNASGIESAKHILYLICGGFIKEVYNKYISRGIKKDAVLRIAKGYVDNVFQNIHCVTLNSSDNLHLLNLLMKWIINNKHVKSDYDVEECSEWNIQGVRNTSITEKIKNIQFNINNTILVTINHPLILEFNYTNDRRSLVKIYNNLQYVCKPIRAYSIINIKSRSDFETTKIASLSELLTLDNEIRSGVALLEKYLSKLQGLDTFDIKGSELVGSKLDLIYSGDVNILHHILIIFSKLNNIVDKDGRINPNDENGKINTNWGAFLGIAGFKYNLSPTGKSLASLVSISTLLKDKTLTAYTLANKFFSSIALNKIFLKLLDAREDVAPKYGLTFEINNDIGDSKDSSPYIYTTLDTGSVLSFANLKVDLNDVSNNLVVTLRSDDMDSESMKLAYEDFINTEIINKIDNKETEPQQVWHIEIERIEHVDVIDNPEYAEFMKLHTNDQTAGGKPSFIDHFRCPPKTISKTRIESKVKATLIRDKLYKPFSSLYLRDEDKNKIYNAIKLFRDRKDLFYTLGLPNKFGLMLHGPPGTGKTSTIYAVSTALSMPLIYVNLSHDLTCNEFKEIFHHVYKVMGGGIIIFEDIDRMTDIVLSSDNKKTSSQGATVEDSMNDVVSATAKDTRLTLSYFLNFLDGALTQDRSVIIATTNNLPLLDTAFKRAGRFDLQIELLNADYSQIKMISKQFIEREPSANLLTRIKEYQYSPAEIIFQLKNYILNIHAPDEEIFEPFIKGTSISMSTPLINTYIDPLIYQQISKIQIVHDKTSKDSPKDIKDLRDQDDFCTDCEEDPCTCESECEECEECGKDSCICACGECGNEPCTCDVCGECENDPCSCENTNCDSCDKDPCICVTCKICEKYECKCAEIKDEILSTTEMDTTVNEDAPVSIFNFKLSIEKIMIQKNRNQILNRYPILRLLLSKRFPDELAPHDKFTYVILNPQCEDYNKGYIVSYIKDLLECMGNASMSNKRYLIVVMIDFFARNFKFVTDHPKFLSVVRTKFIEEFIEEEDRLNTIFKELQIDIDNPFQYWCDILK